MSRGEAQAVDGTVVLLVLLVVALIVLVVVLLRRGRSQDTRDQAGAKGGAPSQPRDPFADVGTGGDPRTIKSGDMVDYLGRRYWVRGSLRLAEGGYSWSEHFLDDVEGTKRWISIEEDPDLEVVLWAEYDDSSLTPAEKVITVEGVEYHRDEHGTASYRSEGTTGLGDSGRAEYVDYEGPGGRYLSFERFGGGAWEVGLGEKVPHGSLTIYPANTSAG